ncbi:hypothetical protein M885DRAFT_179974 [Pelagophyceae sp. CCMP2097]|nr:hypothetical protein M885DRAFT_179974 [Pelagophyceae sp. CCMP2097]
MGPTLKHPVVAPYSQEQRRCIRVAKICAKPEGSRANDQARLREVGFGPRPDPRVYGSAKTRKPDPRVWANPNPSLLLMQPRGGPAASQADCGPYTSRPIRTLYGALSAALVRGLYGIFGRALCLDGSLLREPRPGPLAYTGLSTGFCRPEARSDVIGPGNPRVGFARFRRPVYPRVWPWYKPEPFLRRVWSFDKAATRMGAAQFEKLGGWDPPRPLWRSRPNARSLASASF